MIPKIEQQRGNKKNVKSARYNVTHSSSEVFTEKGIGTAITLKNDK